MVTNKLLEIMFTLFLLAVSIWIVVESFILSLGNLHDPGPGFLCLLGALLMGILSLTNLIKVSMSREKTAPAFSSLKGLGGLILTVVIVTMFALLFETVGFIITSTLFMALMLKLVGQERWVRLSLITISSVILSYVIFKILLNIQLPVGPFGF